MMKKYLFYLFVALLLTACRGVSDESRYIDFLYDNMTLPDSVDYPHSYYEQQVHYAMRARAETVSGKTAFGDASEMDAESDSRRFYALRLGKFNALGRHVFA